MKVEGLNNVGSFPGNEKINVILPLSKTPEYPSTLCFGSAEQTLYQRCVEKMRCVYSYCIDKIHSFVTKTWNCLKSLFEAICCCGICRCQSEKKVAPDLRSTLEKARKDLTAKLAQVKDIKKPDDEFINWWKGEFDKLPEEDQKRIVLEDMKKWAQAKGIADKEVIAWCEERYKDEEGKNKSLEFVKNLKPFDDKGYLYITSVYPLEELPKYLDESIKSLENKN